MDAKDELIRMTEPHLQWIYGPFSKDKQPPKMPKNGDWIITVSTNIQDMLRFNVGKFHCLDARRDRIFYWTASSTLCDRLEWIAAYAFLPPLKHLDRPSDLRQFQTIVPLEMWLHTRDDSVT